MLQGDSMQMCFVQRRLMCCSPVKNGKFCILLVFWVISIFLSFSYKIMKIMWYTCMFSHNFNECRKSEKKKYLIASFLWIFCRTQTKGMLDGLFMFSKSEKHIKKTYPSHGFIFAPGRGLTRWAFQFYRVWKVRKEDSKGFLFRKFSPSRLKKR